MNCPGCDSKNVFKNSSIHNGKPKFECKDCRRQFIENPTQKIITQDQWDCVDKLLLEKLPIGCYGTSIEILVAPTKKIDNFNNPMDVPYFLPGFMSELYWIVHFSATFFLFVSLSCLVDR